MKVDIFTLASSHRQHLFENGNRKKIFLKTKIKKRKNKIKKRKKATKGSQDTCLKAMEHVDDGQLGS